MKMTVKKQAQKSTKGASMLHKTHTKYIAANRVSPKEELVPAEVAYSAKNTKLFDYTGSKLRYKASFEALHQKSAQPLKKVGTYIEAFAGTLASLFHNLAYVKADRYIINDFNGRISNLYQQIQTNPLKLFLQYQTLENEFNRIIPEHLKGQRIVDKKVRASDFSHNEAFFYEVRTVFNQTPLNINNAAMLLFLMNHNYNGIYAENKKGFFNSSFNWSAKEVNTLDVKNALDNLHRFFTENEVIVENMDVFELIEKYTEEDTFIYLDPPYSNSAIQYKKKLRENDFNKVSTHTKLIQLCEKYRYVMYSNNFEEAFVEHFDEHVSFSRKQYSTKKSSKPTLEILALVFHDTASKYLPIHFLLGLEDTNMLPSNTIHHRKIPMGLHHTSQKEGFQEAS